jgi:hypothetical protein
MSSWKIDRPFTHEGVNGYYTNKVAAFPLTALTELPRDIPSDINALGAHLRDTAKDQGLSLTPCDITRPYLWGEEIARQGEKQTLLWRFREYVFGLAMRFIGESASSPTEMPLRIGANPPRVKPATFRIEDHSFTIVGSSELTSDIDITIQGPHSSILIALLEDLFYTLTQDHGVPIRCWDVEFYSDFRLLRSAFVNFHKWNNPQRAVLLKFALVSYFRSTHQVTPHPPVLHPNVLSLVHRALRLIGTNPAWIPRASQGMVKSAYDFWRQTAPNGVLNRELFYRELGRIESDSATIRLVSPSSQSTNRISNNTALGPKTQEFAFGLFTAMATANIHRAESYVLPSTAVHVVEWEQKKASPSNGAKPLPASWFASNARVGIDSFGFLLSAIEQLGYLEHYHPPTTSCSKKGVKYVGRYIRALIQAGVLLADTPMKPVYEQLNAYRSTKDPAVPCPYNIHDVLKQILSLDKPTKPQRGGTRKGRSSKDRKDRRMKTRAKARKH